MPTEIVPLENSHAEAAARLVAERYRAERDVLPLLPERYVRADAVLPKVLGLIDGASGVAATRAGELRGFLVGMAITWRGRPSVYVPEYGHGCEQGDAHGLYRRMYGELSRGWVADGRREHLLTAFAHDRPALDACGSLGYGGVGTDALRDLNPAAGAADVDIRRATGDDACQVEPMENAVREHLAAAPSFLPRDPGQGPYLGAEWLSDPKRALWLAFQDGAPCGFLCMDPDGGQVLPTSGEATVAITGAFTTPETRGAGVATALLNRGLAWAASEGYVLCSVDFETANIPGAAFWLGRGFHPVTQAMFRHVHDPERG